MTAKENSTAYRRGVLLGLTMAEVITLVIFMLLLTFAAMTKKQKEERETYAALMPLIEKNRAAFEVIASAQDLYPDINEDLVRAFEKLPEIAEIVREASLKDDPDKSLGEYLLKIIETEKEFKEQQERAGGKGIPVAQQLKQALAALQQVNDESDQLKNQKKVLISQLTQQGRGFDYPACWYEPGSESKQEFIYNVDLTDSGIVVFDNFIAHRVEDKKSLPLQEIQLGVPLAAPKFRAQTRALFDWSKKNECRFWVTVVDKTGPAKKELYKTLLVGGVESHFYKQLSSGC